MCGGQGMSERVGCVEGSGDRVGRGQREGGNETMQACGWRSGLASAA
jgi:hypothetical protein